MRHVLSLQPVASSKDLAGKQVRSFPRPISNDWRKAQRAAPTVRPLSGVAGSLTTRPLDAVDVDLGARVGLKFHQQAPIEINVSNCPVGMLGKLGLLGERPALPGPAARAGEARDRRTAIVRRLTDERRDLKSRWKRLEPGLKKVAKGLAVDIDAAEIQHRVVHDHGHAQCEEPAIRPLAQQILGRMSTPGQSSVPTR